MMRRRFAAEAKALVVPGPRMADEIECVASVLLAIVFGHLADVENISWAAFSGYMVMRGRVSESVLRGLLRVVGTVLGALLALALIPLIGANPIAAAAALALIGGATLYGTLVGKRSYAWLFVGLTFAMILLDKLEHPGLDVAAFASTRIRGECRGHPGLRAGQPGLGLHLAAALAGTGAAGGDRLRLEPGSGAPRCPGRGRARFAAIPRRGVPCAGAFARLHHHHGGDADPAQRHRCQRVRFRSAVASCSGSADASAARVLAAAFILLAHPAVQATAAVLLAGTVLGVVLGRHIENGAKAIAYAGTQFTLAILVTLVPDSYAHVALEPGIARLTGILAGILLLVPVLAAWHLIAGAEGHAATRCAVRGRRRLVRLRAAR